MRVKKGDLICYNAAGQRRKSLAFVLEIRSYNPIMLRYADVTSELKIVKLMWVKAPEIGPTLLTTEENYQKDSGESFRKGRWENRRSSILWHKLGDWFEKIDNE